MIVQDWKGNEIKVGTKVIYGSPLDSTEDVAHHTATVVAISDPDVVYNPITDADDGGYEVIITIKFADDETETLRAQYKYAHEQSEEVFEEAGDLEVTLPEGATPA